MVKTKHIAASMMVVIVVGACLTEDNQADDGQVGGESPQGLTVSGEVGSPPEVTAEGEQPPGNGYLELSVEGKGQEISDGSLLIVELVSYAWDADGVMTEHMSSHELGYQSLISMDQFHADLPEGITVPPVRDGARVIAFDPLEETKGGELVVMDVVGHYSSTQTVQGREEGNDDPELPVVEQEEGAAPLLRVPVVDPPEDLVVVTHIEGEGEEIEPGNQIVVQYSGVNWDGAAVFDSTWQHHGGPQDFVLGAELLVPAWEEALAGARVGSRLLIVAPPEYAYGESGRTEIGIEPEDTLIYLIDVLGVH